MAYKRTTAKKSAKKRARKRSVAQTGGPTKPDYSEYVGDYVQSNRKFLMRLWGDSGQSIRDKWIRQKTQKDLRDLLFRDLNIKVSRDVNVMVVDIQNARSNPDPITFDPQKDKFYLLVLPPKPVKNPGNEDYEMMQMWNSAYYHAVNDSYGM